MTIGELREKCKHIGPLGDTYELSCNKQYIVLVDPAVVNIESFVNPIEDVDLDIVVIPVINGDYSRAVELYERERP